MPGRVSPDTAHPCVSHSLFPPPTSLYERSIAEVESTRRGTSGWWGARGVESGGVGVGLPASRTGRDRGAVLTDWEGGWRGIEPGRGALPTEFGIRRLTVLVSVPANEVDPELNRGIPNSILESRSESPDPELKCRGGRHSSVR